MTGSLNHELVLHTSLRTGFLLTLDPFHAKQAQPAQKGCSAQEHIARVWAPGTQHKSAVDRPGGAGQTGLIGQLRVTVAQI